MTTTTLPATAAELAAATTDNRDRYVDFLRVFSIGAVVVGHWFLALMLVHNEIWLAKTFAVQLVTWLWQVMPLFFFVGGFSHAVTLRSLRKRGGTNADFLRARVLRLLPPVVLMLGSYAALSVILETVGLSGNPYALAAETVTGPLWFIGVYLAVAVLAPAMDRLHRHYGARVVVFLVVATAAVDVLRLAGHLPVLGLGTELLVWLTIHQLGFCYADGSLVAAGRRFVAVMTFGALAVTTVLTLGTGIYPVAMVGFAGIPSNAGPASFALLSHGFWIVGLAMLLRPVVNRWLRNRRVWTGVIVGNGVIMTIFCWHLTATFLAEGARLLTGIPVPAAGTAAWWTVAVPVWFGACTIALVALVAIFRRFERIPLPSASRSGVGYQVAAVVGTVLAGLGMFAVAATGLDGLLSFSTELVDGIPMTGLGALAILFSGVALLYASGSRNPVR
ncbi:acyltransferase family protein [Fodinicola acaciae]|uniref:acyltransferase family protein n=1 Tax=Fodinicola acaciae TaxID=2681555 RepID=UPI0013D26F98|nr:acyltransferase [Fodinicola acaciae]